MERMRAARSIQVMVIGGLSVLAFGCGQSKEQAAPAPVAKVEVQPKTVAAPPVSAPAAQQSAASNGTKPDAKDKKTAAAKKPSSPASTTTQAQSSISFLPEEPTASKPAVMGADGIASGESMFGRANREMEDREAAAQAQMDRENSMRQMMNTGMGNNRVRSSR